MAIEQNEGVPTQLGHVALRVRDVDRAVEFYTEVLGLKLKHRSRDMAFLGIREDASHELALMPLPADAADPDPARVGMYHFSWEMPSFDALDKLHRRLLDHGVRIGGYSPAPNSANVMFFDPEGNEVEAIWEPTTAQLEDLRQRGLPVPKLAR